MPANKKSEEKISTFADQNAGVNVREAHQTETTEDYVELIADLIDVQKEARASDLAKRLGCHPTVTKCSHACRTKDMSKAGLTVPFF